MIIIINNKVLEIKVKVFFTSIHLTIHSSFTNLFSLGLRGPKRVSHNHLSFFFFFLNELLAI